jgi:hypothetical protein
VQAQQRTAVVEQVVGGLQLEGAHEHLPCLDLHHFTATRLGIQRLAPALECRVDRRALLDAAGQRTQGRVDPVDRIGRHLAFAQHLALGIIGIGDLAQAGHGVVGLAGAEQVAGDLGGFAKADRQQPGGQRIQCAGVATLLGAEQVPHPLQGLVGTQAGRLVQQQDAIDPSEPGARALRTRAAAGRRRTATSGTVVRGRGGVDRGHQSWSGSGCSGGSGFSRSSVSMRSPLSTESS